MTDNWTPNKRKHQAKHPRKVDVTPVIDAGRDYFKLDPHALLASVMIKASALYASEHDQIAFTEGYQQARAQHEAYLLEALHRQRPQDPATN